MSGYEDDILLWSERQGGLLRRLAAGERVNDADLDWENIAEEVESVGRSQLSAVRSLLTRALEHRLKAQAWPHSSHVAGWRAKAVRFQAEAVEAYVPSMRQRLDVDKIYARARRQLPETIDGEPPLPVSPTCLVTLDELLAES